MRSELIGGRYRVEEAVGQGGMGTVWRGRDTVLARDVAIKQVGLLPGESVTDSARALREARSTAALSHRNVVTVFDVVEEAGAAWLVMEHVPSRSLSEIIAEDGPLDPVDVARIGAQVADGLAAAHEVGVVHRDVKPGNVLVRADGVAKISDFGIARTAGDPALTQSGIFVGTPAYLAPELARGADPGPAGDVWALGATLYAAVEGRPPYDLSANHLAVLSRIAEQSPPAPRRAAFLEPVLARMMDRNPATRWSMADAAHALHRLADRHSEGTRATTPPPLTPPPLTPPPLTPPSTAAAAAEPAGDHDGAPHRRGVALLAVAALLTVALLTWWLVGVGDDDPGAAVRSPAPATSERPADPRPDHSEDAEPTDDAPTDTPPSTRSPSAPDPVEADPVTFVERYFSTVPEDTDTGWTMLGPDFRARFDRSSYDSFWSTVADVAISDVTPSRSGETVTATLRYTMKDGRVSVEPKRLTLLRTERGYLINDEEPL